jgi:DNA-binding protein YbaB
MLGGLGDIQQMYKKYQELQNKLAKTLIRAKESGVIIDITADIKVKDVKIEDESLLSVDRKEDLENAIKNAFTKGQQKAQEVAMEKTKEILGFDPNQLAGMMGGQ